MILVVNDYDGLYEPFWNFLGETTTDVSLLFREPDRIKLVCFTGGEDVSPKLYGHENLRSHCNEGRDEKEALIFEQARKHKIPMTGICRGSQFLNVMCGGTMVQDLRSSHGGARHLCETYDGREFKVTSSHHQMSVLGPGGQLLAWAAQPIMHSACIYDPDCEALPKDMAWHWGTTNIKVTEAFAYPQVNVFAVQHHPEWQKIEEEAPQWTLQKIREVCWGEGELTLEVAPSHD
jgi:gamma-glutamyl-gamma-aminobutyrate hydrolase PuuD